MLPSCRSIDRHASCTEPAAARLSSGNVLHCYMALLLRLIGSGFARTGGYDVTHATTAPVQCRAPSTNIESVNINLMLGAAAAMHARISHTTREANEDQMIIWSTAGVGEVVLGLTVGLGAAPTVHRSRSSCALCRLEFTTGIKARRESC